MAPSLFSKRECDIYGNCTSDDGFWNNDGYYARYAIVGAIFLAVIVLLLISYYHAQRRINRGLPPLAYHRWLVRRGGRSRYQPYPPPQNVYAYYQQPGQTYPMNGYMPPPQQHQGWAPPPPAYGQHQWDTPPVYAPPPGATKAAADQNVTEVTRENGEGSSGVAVPAQAYQAPRNEHIITQ